MPAKTKGLKGVEFVVDESGEKKAVLINLPRACPPIRPKAIVPSTQ